MPLQSKDFFTRARIPHSYDVIPSACRQVAIVGAPANRPRFAVTYLVSIKRKNFLARIGIPDADCSITIRRGQALAV
jgi:hypothetical protein